MKPTQFLPYLAFAVFGVTPPVHAQTALRATVLRTEPNVTSKPAQPVAAGAKLEILKREGFWVLAHSGSARGWLRVTELSFAPGSGSVNLSGLDSGRLGKNNIVSSSASRGLSADEIRQSAPDFPAVAALTAMRTDPEAVRTFRHQGGLASVALPPLRLRPEVQPIQPPAATASSSPANKGSSNEDW